MNARDYLFKLYIWLTVAFVVTTALSVGLLTIFPGLDLRLVLIPLFLVYGYYILKGVVMTITYWFSDEE